MKNYKPFSRVYLWWGKYWAFQAYFYPCVSFGIHIDPTKPLIDIHFLCFTLAIGDRPQFTPIDDLQRRSCRGFLRADDPVGLL